MNFQPIQICFLLSLVTFSGYGYLQWKRGHFNRLLSLVESDKPAAHCREKSEIDWARSNSVLSTFKDRFGKAGILTQEERRYTWTLLLSLGFCIIISFAFLGSYTFGQAPVAGVIIGVFVGAYAALLAGLYYLKLCARELEREVMFQMPLTLEELILLVESGLGILPAIQQIVTTHTRSARPNPVTRILRVVYEVAAHGMPFGDALEVVAEAVELRIVRHVLLHLDISGTEGGELIPSLRNLSHHTHLEWKLSVENRVKRLENLVVFPVFASVIGLSLLTAAVPLVPVLKLGDTVSENSQSISTSASHMTTATLGGR